MNLCEPKNIRLSKASFRKSKSSQISGISDEETHQETLYIKRLHGTMAAMDVCMEDPKENFSDQFSSKSDNK